MKILCVTMKYNYGNPKRGYSFEHYNFYDSLVKMDEGKHTVIHFPFDEIIKEKGKIEMNKELIRRVNEEKPDFCFFMLFTDEIDKETIKTISQKSNSITFNWFTDDHWRFDNFSKHWASLFHWVATTDSRAPEKYHGIGYKNVIKIQWACNHFLYRPMKTNFKYDVTFVGQPHGNRKKITNFIKDRGINIDCFGYGWKNGVLGQNKMIQLFSESKINLNLANSAGSLLNLKSLAKIFLKKRSNGSIIINSIYEWIDNFESLKNNRHEQIKGRNFEVPGCGGFLLTNNADNLRDYYENGKEIMIFKDIDDLLEKIHYYLKYDEKREKIALAGYERTIRDHTYEKRFREIFKIIGL